MAEISTLNLLDQNTHSSKCIPGMYAEMYFQSPNRSQTSDITLHIQKESFVESYIHNGRKCFFL